MHCDSAAGTPGTATTTTSVNDSDKEKVSHAQHKKASQKLPYGYIFSCQTAHVYAQTTSQTG